MSQRARSSFRSWRYVVPYTVDEPQPVARPARRLVTNWLAEHPAAFAHAARGGGVDELSSGVFRTTWQPRVPGLVPAVAVSVGMAPQGRNASSLTVALTYTPPGGRAGEALDRMLLGAVFAQSLHHRLQRLARELDAVAVA